MLKTWEGGEDDGFCKSGNDPASLCGGSFFTAPSERQNAQGSGRVVPGFQPAGLELVP